MSYNIKYHTEDMCDKCGTLVGKNNLFKVPFLYCDCNDKSHEDVSYLIGYPYGYGYRQYWICLKCKTEGF